MKAFYGPAGLGRNSEFRIQESGVAGVTEWNGSRIFALSIAANPYFCRRFATKRRCFAAMGLLFSELLLHLQLLTPEFFLHVQTMKSGGKTSTRKPEQKLVLNE